MKKTILLLLILFGMISLVWSQDVIEQTSWQPSSEIEAAEGNLAYLREFHEGCIFLLKRYASLEALLTARELGKPENQSFGIGAASLVPGAGQMMNEDYTQGGLLLFATLTSWGTVQHLSYTKMKRKQHLALLPLYYSSLMLKNGIMTYAMLHAGNQQYNLHADKTAAMWTGLSSIVPGVGQAINGDWWSAAGLFAAWSLAAVATAGLEEKLFISGNENYLVKKEQEPAWTVAVIPNGVLLGYARSW